MRRLRAAAAAVVMLAAGTLAGCGEDLTGSVLELETLRIGVRPDLPLIGWQLPDGSFEGLDVDVARYVADRLGAEVELVATTAADREAFLLGGEVDLVFATFSITADRLRRVAFAGPYFISYQDLLVREAETEIDTIRDLAGRRLCAVAGSNVPQRVVEERGVAAELVPATDYRECLAMLQAGTVDALATNDVILAGLADAAGGGVRLAGARYSQERTGVGMRQGDVAGCEAVNRAITEMYQDGTAQRLVRRWFGGSGIDLSMIAVPQFEGCS